jgi:Transposase DDE domain
MPSYHAPSGSSIFQRFLNGFVHTDDLPFRDVLTEAQIKQVMVEEGVEFGAGADDVYSGPLTLWTWIVQVLSSQKSCVAAVARVLILLTVLGREPCAAGTGAYCKARAKLPEAFLRRLVCSVGRQLDVEVPSAWHWHGHRVHLVDGSTLSMPDTEANQAAYPQPRSQKPGVGFPLLRWVALVSLATGAVLDSAFGPGRGKETGETALLRPLLGGLQAGEVLLADRYYCSYWMVALALARGLHVVFRQHHLRKTDFRRGRRLGRHDHVVTWTKPQRPKWMDQEAYDALPETLTLREVRGAITTPGCRAEQLIVVTTLLDEAIYTTKDILSIYNKRWNVEIDLRSLKTYMKMEILSCKTPEMVRKEIWAHLLAYNLVRKMIAQTAQEKDLTPRQLSFTGAMHTLNEFRALLLTADDDALAKLGHDIVAAIASHRVGNRPNRVEPRKVKRRPKGYPLLRQPREKERAELRSR